MTGEIPICLPCWRTRVSLGGDPPNRPGFPEEICGLCSRRTNHGIYVDPATIRRSER